MDGLAYEATPVKSPRVTTKLTRKLAAKDFDRLGTPTILWMLAKRHKYGLVVNALLLENVYILLHFFTVV